MCSLLVGDARIRTIGRRIEEGAHIGDLLSLLDDDRLREAFEALVLPVLEQHPSHVDGALVMRDHHPYEITVDIAAARNCHAIMHAGVDAISA